MKSLLESSPRKSKLLIGGQGVPTTKYHDFPLPPGGRGRIDVLLLVYYYHYHYDCGYYDYYDCYDYYDYYGYYLFSSPSLGTSPGSSPLRSASPRRFSFWEAPLMRHLWHREFSRARILAFLCEVWVRIRRLRESPQYLLVILKSPQISTILRKTSTRNAQRNVKILARETCWKAELWSSPFVRCSNSIYCWN